MSKFIPWIIALIVVGGVAMAWKKFQSSREGLEKPDYRVASTYDDLEVREYAPRIQAQVTVDGPREDATSAGFRILAGYIFGGNTGQEKIAMTAPVSTSADTSEKIAMTAPVSTQAQDQGYTISFMMPSKWTLDTLPVPDDGRIQLLEVPGYQAAVRTFSGRVTPKKIDAQSEKLRASMQAQGLSPQGEVMVSQFDPPWTLFFMRRNEVELRVQ
ncbi:MAG: hypothetical protein ACI9VR_001148 [Cognaticolwellia sp.]|jgi:hypothetical protein